MEKYYYLHDMDGSSIGVIKTYNGEIPKDKIKEAIESHFDETSEILSVELFDSDYEMEVTVKIDDNERLIYGTQTWLYF